MRLTGMLDSPYVRRVAISLKMMRLPFEHEAVSVFRHFERFAEINPVVKAPTLVTEGGVVLMDSTLILEYAEQLAAPSARLAPADPGEFARAQRIIGLALAACEKTVQIVYEHQLRPAEKLHQPWIDRVQGQLATAYRLLETELDAGDAWLFGSDWLFGDQPLQADVTTAVAWRFTRHMLPDRISPADYPGLAAFSERAEALPEFLSTPVE